ncbi:MAG: hypothetical protein GY711_23225 [bacterium]|nr:hypothetical protein [bacterium]
MTSPRLGLALLTVLALAGRGAGAQVDAPHQVQLSPKPLEKWDLIVPLEAWHPVGDTIDVGGIAFTFGAEGRRLLIDTDADGKPNVRTGSSREFVTLRGKDESGTRFAYSLRLRNTPTGWAWAPGSVMSGRLSGRQVRLIDRNGNGRYDDFGQDAIVIGAGTAASFLSRVINLGGDLFNFDVSADGRRVTIDGFEGETASIDVHDRFRGKANLIAAVFADGELSFNAADARRMLVPAGEYKFISGFARGGAETVHIGTGQMTTLELPAGADVKLEWGGPVRAEFDYTVHGNQLTVRPNVNFYGSFGEEYYTFQPNARSPKVIVKDKATGRVVQSGRFGGCCGGGFSAFKGKVPPGMEFEVTIEHNRSMFGDIRGVARGRRPEPIDR